ncbi:hypothetical protein Fcan01_07529 [Folsomia candida]|uniref:Uncharacterized protein n=1 Tax=Folsomia candida TaxID=158441 RepID=A0A226EJH7_FOLCA|nr:hypothetical protein Fcan01_07529 [Folsomia candida]
MAECMDAEESSQSPREESVDWTSWATVEIQLDIEDVCFALNEEMAPALPAQPICVEPQLQNRKKERKQRLEVRKTIECDMESQSKKVPLYLRDPNAPNISEQEKNRILKAIKSKNHHQTIIDERNAYRKKVKELTTLLENSKSEAQDAKKDNERLRAIIVKLVK